MKALLMVFLVSLAACGNHERTTIPAAASAAPSSTAGRAMTAPAGSTTARGTTTPTTRAPALLAGSYWGSYASTSGTSDNGLVGFLVHQNLSLQGMAISAIIPNDPGDFVEATVQADGTVAMTYNATGTQVTLDLLRRTGSWTSSTGAGSITLSRVAPGVTEGCYAGTYSSAQSVGRWVAIIDSNLNLFAVCYDTQNNVLLDGLRGSVTSRSPGSWDIQAAGTNGQVRGTLSSNGTIGGTWTSTQYGSGPWDGSKD